MYQQDSVENQMRDGKTTISINSDERSISHTILAQPHRSYFMEKVKAPLQKAFEILSLRWPQPNHNNVSSLISNSLLDIFEDFKLWNTTKPKMFAGAERVLVDEVEHDIVYRNLFTWFIEKIILKILEGKWNLRTDMKWCKEDNPSGLKKSFLYKFIAHRKEILTILGTVVDGDPDTKFEIPKNLLDSMRKD